MDIISAKNYVDNQIAQLQQPGSNSKLNDEVSYDTYLRVQKELDHLIKYPQYYQNILDKNKDSENISIFQKNSQFTKEMQEKIREHYVDKQLDAGTSSYGSFGVEQVINYPFLDIAVILLVAYFLYLLIDKEQEQGSIAFIQTMKKGNYRLYLRKFSTIVLATTLFVVITYIALFIVSGLQYGFPNVTNPIQSVLGCGSVYLNITILQFLLIFLLIRCLFYGCLIVLLYGLTFILNRMIFSILTFLFLLFIGNTLSQITADHNSLSAFFALGNFLHPETSFIQVSYISIFNYAWYFPIVYFCLALICIGVLFIGYRKYEQRTYRHISLPHWKRKHLYHTLLGYEVKKTWGKGMGCFACIIAICFLIVYLSNITSLSYRDDKIIAYYIDHIGSSPTTQTLQKIENEKTYFSDIHKKMETATNEQEIQMLNEQLENEQAFDTYCERMENLQKDTSRNVLKEDETRLFFEQDTVYGWMLIAQFSIMILLCLQSISKEQQSGVEVYQQMTIMGNKKLFKCKHRAVYSILMITWSIAIFVLWMFNQKIYPQVSYQRSIQDLQQFFTFPFRISILTYLVLQLFVQLLSIYMMSYCILFIFSRIKSNKQIAIILLLLSIMPILMFMMQISPATLHMVIYYPYWNIWMFIITFGILIGCTIVCVRKQRKGALLCEK